MLIKINIFFSFFYDNNVSYYIYYVIEITFIFLIKSMEIIEDFENSIRTNNYSEAKETFFWFFLFIVAAHFIFLVMYNNFIYFLVNLKNYYFNK